jgi:protein ImuB
MSVRTLAVGCPRWPIVAADHPPDAPAAVFFANRVVSASPEAVACGVRKGMRRREAQSIVPEIEVLLHDPVADARAFEPIVGVVETFSPRVEIVRPGLCVLAARGPARYFGGEDELRRRVAEAVDEAIAALRSHPLHTDDRTRTGIADGPFAATLAAMRGRVVPPLHSPAFLSPFGIEQLEQPDLADLLRRMGIRTLGELAALSRHRVTARFGLSGEIAHRMASGDDERLLEPRPIPPDLVITRELEPPAKRVDVAMFAGKSAADELSAKLMELGLSCAKIEISVATEHDEARMRIWRYSSAFTPAAIAERVRWQLEGWLNDAVRHRPTGGIARLCLQPLDVGAATGTKVGFWNRRGEVSDRVRRSVARVQGLLGQHGAQQAVLSGGRHPSEQATLVGWGDPLEPQRAGLPGTKTAPGPVEVEMPPWPGRLPAPSPTIVHTEALRTDVVDSDGDRIGVGGRFSATGEPARVRMHGRWIEVVGWAGPWPVDERWWDTDAHRRRARFQVSLADGTAHLLTLESGSWTVEATYD